jgi:dienelactone hydrolase
MVSGIISAIGGFSEETFTTGERSFRLFSKGNGPGVILLHELPGLTHETVEFAEWIADHDFHVVMPLLFGSPLQNPMLGLLKSPVLCVRKEFNNFESCMQSEAGPASVRSACATRVALFSR